MEYPKDQETTNRVKTDELEDKAFNQGNAKPKHDRKPRTGRQHKEDKERRNNKPRDSEAGEGQEGQERRRDDKGKDGYKKKRENENRFQYPENWKEDIFQNTTLETKIPSLPNKDDQLQKPDFNLLKKTQGDLSKKIEKAFNDIEALKEKRKAIKEEIYKKNSSGFAELKAKQTERNDYRNKKEESQKKKEALIEEKKAIREKIEKLMKKAVNGKLMKKSEIEKIIRTKEEEYRNGKHTSSDEKKHIEEIQNLKKNLPLLTEYDNLSKEKSAINKKIDQAEADFQQHKNALTKVYDEIKAIKAKLDLQEAEKTKEEKNEEGKPKEKPKRELTQPEKDINANIDKMFEDIKKFKARKGEVSKKFDEDFLAFEKEQFEIAKINMMVIAQKKLKHQEHVKRRAEEEAKNQQLMEEQAKEMAQFKYRKEIETCEGLVRILNLQKPENRAIYELKPEVPVEYKVDETMLANEKLVLLKSKKTQDEGVQPGHKRLNNKKNVKKPVEQKEDDKLLLDIETLQTFADIKVMAPVTMSQIDSVIAQLNEKKAYYEKLREEEMNQALTQTASEPKEEGEQAEAKPRQKEAKARNEGKADARKKVEMTEADFPSLN